MSEDKSYFRLCPKCNGEGIVAMPAGSATSLTTFEQKANLLTQANNLIQELEQKNKELRGALKVSYEISILLQDAIQTLGKLRAVVPSDIEAKLKLVGEKSERLRKEFAQYYLYKLLKQ